MSIKTVSGWFLADEEQSQAARLLIKELPDHIAKSWNFQERDHELPMEYKFIHFGAYLNHTNENIFLDFLTKAAKSAISNYDDPCEYIEGDFFIMDLNRQSAELRLRIAYGNLSIDEREPFRPNDLQCS